MEVAQLDKGVEVIRFSHNLSQWATVMYTNQMKIITLANLFSVRLSVCLSDTRTLTLIDPVTPGVTL